MRAQEIVQKLKSSPYKFTFASKIRDEIKKMEDDDSDLMAIELRREMSKPDNRDIMHLLKEILS